MIFKLTAAAVSLGLLLTMRATPSSAQATPTKIAPADLTHLPLGDQKASSEPKHGYIYACPRPGGGPTGAAAGAFKDGPWIDSASGTWDSTSKVSVSGEVKWPDAAFTITFNAAQRVIASNGLPVDVTTGLFPIQPSEPAYQYDRNPNHISMQTVGLAVPLNPTLAPKASCVGMGMIGVLVDGVALYNGFDAGNRDAVAHETQDSCKGHPDMSLTYHYHSISPCLIAADNSNLVGYALDGFGIYGFKGDKGYTNADLDECHGITSPVLWNGSLTTIYHYQATYEFPYTLGCFRGTPVQVAGPASGGPPGGRPPPKP